MYLLDFIAIDFETANDARTSACSLGIAIFRDNKLVDTKSYYIKPYPYRFKESFIEIHHITKEQVADCPTFGELWNEISYLFDNEPTIVAHFAQFDIDVLINSLTHYNIPIPNFNTICSVKVAKSMLPELDNHKLNTVSNYLNIELDHHEAVSDALACGAIICNFANNDSITLDEYCNNNHINAGRCENGRYRQCGFASIASIKVQLKTSPIENTIVEYNNKDWYENRTHKNGIVQTYLISKIKIHNSQLYDISCIKLNDFVRFEHDYRNPYDNESIMISVDNNPIGFVPAAGIAKTMIKDFLICNDNINGQIIEIISPSEIYISILFRRALVPLLKNYTSQHDEMIPKNMQEYTIFSTVANLPEKIVHKAVIPPVKRNYAMFTSGIIMTILGIILAALFLVFYAKSISSIFLLIAFLICVAMLCLGITLAINSKYYIPSNND